jgi:hypothetical protein
MSTLLMEFYHVPSGALITLRWRNKEEYLLGKTFLKQLLGEDGGSSVHEPGRAPYYHLENDQQRDALYDFRRALREKNKRSPA